MALYSCFVFLLLIHQIYSFEEGAPISTCFTQYPKHDGTGAQTKESPYAFTFSPAKYVPGQEVVVEVTGPSFSGFQIAARRTRDNPEEIVGTFVKFDTGKLKSYNCFGGYKNMLTHKNEHRVSKLTFTWKAPSDNVGDVAFKATIVRSYRVFWVGVMSQLAVESNLPYTPSIYPSIAVQSKTTAIDFDACGGTKGCVYYPTHCSGNDCIAAATYQYRPKTKDFLFELHSNHDVDYISIGFSHDEWMGNDFTVSCTGRNGEMSVQEGFNPGYYNERHLDMFHSSPEVKYLDGKLQCLFVMPETFDVYKVIQKVDAAKTKETKWDLKKQHYIMLAWGQAMAGSSVIAHHQEFPAVSLSEVDLTAKEITGSTAFHTLVKAHAALMMIAWIIVTGLVTLVSRHYRDWMPRTRWFDTKVWFQIHRGLAILVFTLTVIGITLIFVNYGPKIRSAAMTHAGVGLAVLACLCIQIIAALIRPGGEHKMRVYFNWGHWALGHVTHILSAATLFLAFGIEYITPDLKKMGFIVLAVWVVIDILWKIGFEVMRWRRKQTDQCLVQLQDEPMVDLQDVGENQFKVACQEAGETNKADAILLGLYLFCLLAMCIAGIVIFAMF